MRHPARLETTDDAWRPILRGDDAVRAERALADIEAALAGPLDLEPEWAHSLAEGAAGIATFYAYRGDADAAGRWLRDAAGAVGRTRMDGSLYDGLTGVAWALAHHGSGATDDVDRWLRRRVAGPHAPGDHELMTGLAGYAVYALERLPDPGARECLEQIVTKLGELAVADGDGVTWLSRDGSVNLGVAHGVPAVVAVLGACCAAGVAEQRAQSLLAGAVRRLLAQRLPAGAGARFRGWLGSGAPAEPAPSAWCYGDPGIATALLLAARGAGEPAWEREALALARGVARRPRSECGIDDAGLCHGAAGLGHVLNRLHQATGDPELLAAARHWLRRALDLREPGTGVAGFSAQLFRDDGRPYPNADGALLRGAAGVGLALLAATTDVAPDWDRVMLLSYAPEAAA
jgi:lantibiotic biosynthesis protein